MANEQKETIQCPFEAYTFEKADKELGEYLDFGLFAFWALKVPEGVDPAHIEPFYIHEPKVIKSTMQFLDKASIGHFL